MRTIDGKRGGVLLLALLASVAWASPTRAQGWPSWADDAFSTGRGRMELRRDSGRDADADRDFGRDAGRRPEPRRDLERGSSTVAGGDVRDGGPRPELAPLAPATVAFEQDFPANSIVIDTGARALYYVLPDKRAYRYAISVGREGFNWTGTEKISRKQAWPDWYPPAEMRERDPKLPEKMTGGVKNPLGAMALYLGDTLYRIHGTNDVKSIGQAQSSGCFRMLNTAVLHLAAQAEIGTPVAVVASLPARQQIGRAPEPPAAGGQAQPASGAASLPTTSPEATAEPLPDYRSLRNFALERR
jgi:lipoprotein-anchoring transpeptidase ErfK/SrfK